MKQITKAKGISTFALVLLISGSIDSIRNLPTAALFGPELIFFFIFGAIALLLPTALVSAELTSAYPEKGGVYAWTCKAFGNHIGFFAIWLQWINTAVWYPTILSFVAGVLAFIIDPALAQNKFFLIGVILVVFWILTWLNLKGLEVSTRFTSICAIFGLIIPMMLIIILAVIWVMTGKPVQIHFNGASIMPSWNLSQSWISLTAIMTSFLGMELATVHVRDVNNPRRSFPRALLIAVIIILSTMLGGSLAIAIVVPQSQIHLVAGVMEAFTEFFTTFHLRGVIEIVAVMLFAGSLGEMINWIISPARGLLQAGREGYLPRRLCKINKHGVAGNILILQALLVSGVCAVFLFMPNINSSYWLLTDLSTELYLAMYVLMFMAAIVIKWRFPEKRSAFQIPGGRLGMLIVCLCGIIGCSIAIIVGFFPPATLSFGNTFHYESIFSMGLIVMCSPVIFFYGYKFFVANKRNHSSMV